MGSLNLTILKIRGLNWTKVKLDDWNEFKWNLGWVLYFFPKKNVMMHENQ